MNRKFARLQVFAYRGLQLRPMQGQWAIRNDRVATLLQFPLDVVTLRRDIERILRQIDHLGGLREGLNRYHLSAALLDRLEQARDVLRDIVYSLPVFDRVWAALGRQLARAMRLLVLIIELIPSHSLQLGRMPLQRDVNLLDFEDARLITKPDTSGLTGDLAEQLHLLPAPLGINEIGRASCRERV